MLEANGGVKVLMSRLNLERVIIYGGPLGIIPAALDVTLPYIHERWQFDRPIGILELMQGKLVDMFTALQSSRVFCYRIAENCEKRQVSKRDTAACLLFASENTVKVYLEAIHSFGGNGYINDYPTDRLLRYAKLYDICADTNAIRRMLIGSKLFNESA